MNKIYNNRAFEILLDSYSEESHNLYCVIKSLFDYPNTFDDDQYSVLEGKLYSAAFAHLVSTYLISMAGMSEHGDFGLFVGDMEFEEHADELIEIAKKQKIEIDENLEYDEDEEENPLNDIVWEVMYFYRGKIATDIQNLFVDKSKIINLFASIFEFNQEVSAPYFRIDEIDFYVLFEEEMGFKI
ncbi:hypothetical protein V9L05_18305 [Bernardetia sp. Wsw4-3y2]|uniref:hypothetical protein n=1 Tax=Bernardetia sp. Wsw4-3y2 TaxID=3127471 RepID=UPI0030CE3EE6